MSLTDYPRGLADLGNNCYAWMLPDGSWGWSNSGLIVGDGESLLVDTHFDLALTQEMLDGISSLTDAAPLRYSLISHANGDHYFGHQLLPDNVEIIASEAANVDITQADVDRLAGLKDLDGPVGDFARHIFGPFDFSGVVATPATRTFSGEMTLDVGGREVVFIQAGPAHTPGDVITLVPDARTLYAADILFIGGTPIVWAGPIERWIDVCDQILAMDVDTIVPGHGPVTDKDGVRGMKGYLEFVREKATELFHKGVPAVEAAYQIDLGKYGELAEKGRIIQNVISVYQTLDPSYEGLPVMDVIGHVGAIEGFKGKGQ